MRTLLITGWDGSPDAIEKSAHYAVVPLRSFRIGSSFAGTVTPRLLLSLLSRRHQSDLHHVHLARDLTVMPAAVVLALLRRPLVIQPHGMVVKSRRLPHRLIDRVATRFVLGRASAVLALNSSEATELESLGAPRSRISVLPNGVPIGEAASAVKSSIEVIFVGRLHERKRVLEFARAALAARDAGDHIARFTVVGPDEGDLSELLHFIDVNDLRGTLTYEGALAGPKVSARIRRASVLVMPSREEPFGLVAVEALAQGVPVVVDREARFLDHLPESIAVRRVDGSSASDIRRGILDCLTERDSRAVAAQATLRSSPLSDESVASRLMAIYRRAAGDMDERPHRAVERVDR